MSLLNDKRFSKEVSGHANMAGINCNIVFVKNNKCVTSFFIYLFLRLNI